MPYVITEACIGQKHASCVEVCPVDCIHPTPHEPGFAEAEQLFVNPQECIDCDACSGVCPVDAILPEVQVIGAMRRFVALNARYFAG
jgi:NAD-dependent dihydropyrimidine dehydrogenase PreA subunit